MVRPGKTPDVITSVAAKYREHDMPGGWILPNDGYGCGYTDLEGVVKGLKNTDSVLACGPKMVSIKSSGKSALREHVLKTRCGVDRSRLSICARRQSSCGTRYFRKFQFSSLLVDGHGLGGYATLCRDRLAIKAVAGIIFVGISRL